MFPKPMPTPSALVKACGQHTQASRPLVSLSAGTRKGSTASSEKAVLKVRACCFCQGALADWDGASEATGTASTSTALNVRSVWWHRRCRRAAVACLLLPDPAGSASSGVSCSYSISCGYPSHVQLRPLFPGGRLVVGVGLYLIKSQSSSFEVRRCTYLFGHV